MGVKYVDNFEFPEEAGFTGSAGKTEVKPHMRNKRAPKPKAPGVHDQLKAHGKQMGFNSTPMVGKGSE